jgi:hypothetical protein
MTIFVKNEDCLLGQPHCESDIRSTVEEFL